MGESVSTAEITLEQKALIERGVSAGLSFEAIRLGVLEIASLPDDDIRDEVDGISQVIELRRQFKKEGARLLREFVGRIKNGSDVDDMAAMLELAIYRDLLRRYTQDDKAFTGIPIDKLLMLDIHYRRVRIACQSGTLNGKGADSAKKLYARMLPKIVNKLVSLADAKMAEEINAMRGQIMEWGKGEFGSENIKEIENEENEREQLNAIIAEGRSCADSQAEAGNEKALGVVE